MAAAIAAVGYGPVTIHLYQELAAIWAAQDSPRAEQWALSLESRWEQTSAITGVSSTIAVSESPESAYDWASQVLDETQLAVAASAIASASAAVRPEETAEWVKTLDSPRIVKSAATALGRTWSGNDRLSAAAFLDSQPESIQTDYLTVAVAETWSLENGEEAAVWLSGRTLQNEDFRATSVYSMISDWAGQSPDAAEKWAIAQSNGEVRDQALLGVAETFDTLKPERALRLLLQIEDPETRGEALRRFQSSHPDKAKAADFPILESD